MPTNRTRKPRTTNRISVKDWQIKVLETGEYPEDEGFEGLHFFYSNGERDQKLEIYQTIKKDFIADWIAKNPCTRPWSWWQYTCPRQKDADTTFFWHGTLPEERLHIGGGRRSEQNYVPPFHKAIFRYWNFTDDDVPLFESEAAFLKRHDLLTDDEQRHLEKHPEISEPESIVDAIPGINPEIEFSAIGGQ